MFNNYFLLLLLVIGTTGLSAQITITADNYGSRDSVFLQDSVFLDSTYLTTPPQRGADQVWDYSDIDINLYLLNLNFPVEEDTCFAGANSYNLSSLDFQGFEYPIKNYEVTNDSGRYTQGQKVEEIKFSLLPVTGNPADTLTFISSTAELNTPFIRFPSTFGSSFTDSARGVNPFTLSVAAFGLNGTPGEQVFHTVKHTDIVGSGTIILPQRDGSVTDPIEVLLSRDSTIHTTTYTLGGGPAPAALLQAFGLSEVNVSTRVSYFFHAKGIGRSVARMLQVDDNGVNKFEFGLRTIAPGATTAVRNHELLNLAFYPNPVSPGESIRLAGLTGLTAGTMRLLDLQGRVISEATFTNNNAENVNVTIPAAAKPGLYFYQLRNEAGRPVGAGKVMVR